MSTALSNMEPQYYDYMVNQYKTAILLQGELG